MRCLSSALIYNSLSLFHRKESIIKWIDMLILVDRFQCIHLLASFCCCRKRTKSYKFFMDALLMKKNENDDSDLLLGILDFFKY